MLWFIFFDILWLIICDIEIFFNFEWLFVMQLLVSYEFYTIFFFCLFFHNFFLFILIIYNKQVDTANPFNKWIVLGLRNLNPFNKHVGLVLTHILMIWHDTNPTHKHELSPLIVILVAKKCLLGWQNAHLTQLKNN